MNWKSDIYRYLYINENYRILSLNEKITEGGLARNCALMNWINNNIKNLTEFIIGKNRVKNLIYIFSALLFRKKYNIVFQYTTVGFNLHSNKILGRTISKLFLLCIKFSSRFNNIIFDVSDIKYEQLIDLSLSRQNIDIIKNFEKKFFELPIEFIFASYSMREYVCKKYDICEEDTDVCINGGNILDYDIENNLDYYINNDKITYVYSGTLNKGRQIEEMISNFPLNDKVELILMGSCGEWIRDIKINKNIKYLGAMEEKQAHYFVSKCDIGLIPYDESKFYFNIAYPTKLSFYVTAGITFISTDVREVKNISDRFNIGYVEKIEKWDKLINDITIEQLKEKNKYIEEIRQDFYWNNIFANNKFIRN
jgi:hypothetical protein